MKDKFRKIFQGKRKNDRKYERNVNKGTRYNQDVEHLSNENGRGG